MELGDAEVFREVFRTHVGLVKFALREFRLPEEDRDEIVQETFLKLFRAAGQVDHGKLKGFLVITAKNLVIDRYRRRQSQRTEASADVADEEARLWQSDPGREIDLAVCGEAIDEIAALPGGAAFRMFYRDGMTLREIAEATGEPLGTISARVARLRERFKEGIRVRIEAQR